MPSLQSSGAATKVYTIQGGAGSTTPDWLGSGSTRAAREKAAKRRRKGGKAGTEGKSLIQDFSFPEASNRIRSTSDGKYIIATGTYKPRMKVFELDELAIKFDRVTDSETVDFCILSSDWTKTIHLQTDRTIDVHTQTHSYFRTRIPTHGRSIGYHFPSCEALVAGTGSQVYRLNLSQGQFLAPLDLDPSVNGVNVLDINPAHGLLSLGTETDAGGTVEFWDLRARARAASLKLPQAQLSTYARSSLPGVDGQQNGAPAVNVTALSSRSDGLNLAVGTSSGHVLLYDLRTSSAYTVKDQGYSLPIKSVSWPSGMQATAGSGLVCSADDTIIKIWDRNDGKNLVAINPPAKVNDVHIYPDSGVVMLANEASSVSAYFVPSLGPAPRWARFLENMTEEMEDEVGSHGEALVYDDYKFIDSNELEALGLDHLVGTPTLKPYMHGYFINLKLYHKAKAIANPFAWQEHREKVVRDKLAAEQQSRIRSATQKMKQREVAALARVGVNKNLAKRILERESGRSKKERVVTDDNATSLLADSRFQDVFQHEEFEIDEYSKEFAMLNPSLAEARKRRKDVDSSESDVEEEEVDEEEEEVDDDDDDDVESELENVSSKISNKPQLIVDGAGSELQGATLGKRLRQVTSTTREGSFNSHSANDPTSARSLGGGAMELKFTPSAQCQANDDKVKILQREKVKAAKAKKNMFGIGLSKKTGGDDANDQVEKLKVTDRDGRKSMRKVSRSASKNAMRRRQR